ncbi:uncharacterized protein DEA37_0011743 [Paragonimus westermani]|uniref:Uncharacterized protein n=1 Tax=Paragonimus westermani TaxID=34504 RepID=A0A5J4NV38_9TREM|nr:uncharacterized protein DEA37_0011742 [Paragonimus westermani]KAA3678988.1 uncharacterized protein DEA37_0011743 [Paragonimus westermani]
MGPYILSFLSEEAAKVFRTTGVRPTAPAPVIWETLRQLFEKPELPAVYREKFSSHRQKPEESVGSVLRDLRELASKTFKHLAPVDCERNICERFCMGLRNWDLRNKFILKPPENLSVALTKAAGCEALEQLDEKRAAEDSICLAFCQHSLTPEPLPRRNQPAIPSYISSRYWSLVFLDTLATSSQANEAPDRSSKSGALACRERYRNADGIISIR